MAKVKNFFGKIGQWFRRHAPTKRRLIQIYAALLFNANLKGYFGKGNNVIYRGATKYLCTPGLNCYSCPGAVTACPLGALQNAMASSKTRAPYYIIGIIALLGLMLGRTICGFLCPTGLGQDLLYKIKSPKLRKSRYTRILSYFKYVLLVVCVLAIPLIYQGIPAFCKYFCPAGTFGGALALLANPANADLYAMLGYLFSWKFILLVVFIVGSIFIYRFFCRFFCPLGAILGFFNKFAFIGVCFDKEKCTDCGLCVRTCKMDVRHVGDRECIHCGACIKVCPTNAIHWKGSKFFLPANETEAIPETEPAPLTAMRSASTTSSDALPENTAVSVLADGVQSSVTPQNALGDNLIKNAETPPTEQNETRTTPDAPQSPEKKVRTAESVAKRNFRLQIGAWCAAMVLLAAALVYFNFLAPTNVTTVYAVGDRCPDFTLDTYVSAGATDADGSRIGKFSTMESKGTVMVINFWYTTCDPCVEELPEFAEVKEAYGDNIVMVAVHAPNMASARVIQEFIDTNGWSEWGIIFAQDTDTIDSFTMLGGKSAYPITAIVDTDGYISYMRQGKVSKEELTAQIEIALGH